MKKKFPSQLSREKARREKHNLEKLNNVSVKETVDSKSLNHTNASEVIEEESSKNVSVKESLDKKSFKEKNPTYGRQRIYRHVRLVAPQYGGPRIPKNLI